MKQVREFIEEFSNRELLVIFILLALLGTGAGYYAANSLIIS